MSISRLINEHSTISAFLSVMAIVGAFVWVVHGSSHIEPQYYYGYFYDLDRGELFVDVRTKASPIEAPSGDESGVLAAVFSCGACEDKSTHFVGWIERYSPEARDILLAERTGTLDMADPDAALRIAKGHQIALPPKEGQEPVWLAANSPDAARILPKALQRCGESSNRAQACNPVAEDLP